MSERRAGAGARPAPPDRRRVPAGTSRYWSANAGDLGEGRRGHRAAPDRAPRLVDRDEDARAAACRSRHEPDERSHVLRGRVAAQHGVGLGRGAGLARDRVARDLRVLAGALVVADHLRSIAVSSFAVSADRTRRALGFLRSSSFDAIDEMRLAPRRRRSRSPRRRTPSASASPRCPGRSGRCRSSSRTTPGGRTMPSLSPGKSMPVSMTEAEAVDPAG